MDVKSRVQPLFLAGSSTGQDIPVQDSQDTVIVIQGGGQNLPPDALTAPTKLSTAAAAIKSGVGKCIGQTFSSGVGELAGSGVRIGLNALDSLPGARVPMLAVKAATVVVVGGLAGYRAGLTVQEAYGVSSGTRAVVSLVPVLVPVGLAVGTGLSGGSLLVASTVLGECVARMTSSGVRDVLNEFGRGALGDTQAVDAEGKALTRPQAADRRSTTGLLAPVVPNFGTALMGQLALPQEVDQATGHAAQPPASSAEQFGAGLGEDTGAAVVKGGFALAQEGGRAVAAIADGGGLMYVPGRGMSAIADNFRDYKTTLGRAWEHSSMRIAMGAVSGDLASTTHAGPYATAALQAAGESRSGLVEKAQAERERGGGDGQDLQDSGDGMVGGPRVSQASALQDSVPLQVQGPPQEGLPGYMEREDSSGSVELGDYAVREEEPPA